MNRVEKEFEIRKNKILNSAKKLFIKYGFDNVSLNQIAKESDFGKSTLYHYFSSKNEILYIIIRQHDMKRLKLSQTAFNEAQSSFDKIYAYLKEYYNYVKNHNYVLFMLTYHNDFLFYRYIIPSLSDELKDKYENHFAKDAETLKEQLLLGEEDGFFKNIKDKNFQLGYIMATTRGLIFFIFQHLFSTKTLSEKEADSYYDFHLNMILTNL